MSTILNIISTILIIPIIILVLIFSFTKKAITEKIFQPTKLYKTRQKQTTKILKNINKTLKSIDELIDKLF